MGEISRVATLELVVQRKQLSKPCGVRTLYPTMPCSPGEAPVDKVVKAVAVVLGAVVTIAVADAE